MKSLAFLDYAVIAAFFAVMIGVGVYYSRKSKSSDQFFGNDKTVPWWLSGVSFYMNSFSALAFVMYSALAYKFGWVPVTVSWLSVPAVLLGAWFLAAMRAKWPDRNCRYLHYNSSTDARHVQDLGLPMLLLGVETSDMHARNERVRVESIGEYAELIEGFLAGRKAL